MKKVVKPDKSSKAFRKLYMTKMATMVTHSEAKRLSINPLDNQGWITLRRMVKEMLKARYKTMTLMELVEDMKYNKATTPLKIAKSKPNIQNFKDNHDLCFRFGDNVTPMKKKWMEDTRKIQVMSAPELLCNIESAFWNCDVMAYLRVPFIVDDKVYFAAIFIPETETIIEPYRSEVIMTTKDYNEYVKRVEALKTVCKNLVILDGNPYPEERIIKELIPQCAKSVVLGPLGQPMNKIV